MTVSAEEIASALAEQRRRIQTHARAEFGSGAPTAR